VVPLIVETGNKNVVWVAKYLQNTVIFIILTNFSSCVGSFDAFLLALVSISNCEAPFIKMPDNDLINIFQWFLKELSQCHVML